VRGPGQGRAASEAMGASSQASDRKEAAVRAFLAEGAPGMAPHLPTSDGICDSADPAV